MDRDLVKLNPICAAKWNEKMHKEHMDRLQNMKPLDKYTFANVHTHMIINKKNESKYRTNRRGSSK